MRKTYSVYIMTNQRNATLYTGFTSFLLGRNWQHKNKVAKGFTKKYNINKLVYFETYNNPNNTIRREKQIKAGSRKRKIELIEKENPEWKDLIDELF